MVLIDDAEEELVPLDFAEATRVASPPVFREKGFQDDAIELVVE